MIIACITSTTNGCLYLLFYVDHMLLIGFYVKVVNKITSELHKEFDMKDLGHVKVLGTKIEKDRSNSCLFVYQTL